MNENRDLETVPRTKSYRDLIVWQRSIQLVKKVYEVTRSFPADERFGLVSQMRRAAVSISSNIAEGQARRTTGEFTNFLSQAEGSTAELDTQFLIACELEFDSERSRQEIPGLIDEVSRMLNALRRSVSPKLATRH
ncbi:MAG: S23 ribosomal protein [Planctomycetota bacterium]|nr:MAG: S23 ribosomal protein [Planctomycetota bacterium]